MAPVEPWLAKVKAVDKAGYAALLAAAASAGIGGPFRAGVGRDDKNPEVYVVGLNQSGLGLPDRDYYLSSDAKLAETKAAYQAHIAKVLTMAGETDAEEREGGGLRPAATISAPPWRSSRATAARPMKPVAPVTRTVQSLRL